MRGDFIMEENIIVCRTADGDLIAYDSFADAVANAVENSDKDIAEIAITANDNYKYIITRKIGRKGLLLHDILEDKEATDAEKEDARKQLDILADGIVSDSIATIRDKESGARNEEIDSIEVVFYKGSCDNIYVKTREYYENYKKRQALR